MESDALIKIFPPVPEVDSVVSLPPSSKTIVLACIRILPAADRDWKLPAEIRARFSTVSWGVLICTSPASAVPPGNSKEAKPELVMI